MGDRLLPASRKSLGLSRAGLWRLPPPAASLRELRPERLLPWSGHPQDHTMSRSQSMAAKVKTQFAGMLSGESLA